MVLKKHVLFLYFILQNLLCKANENVFTIRLIRETQLDVTLTNQIWDQNTGTKNVQHVHTDKLPSL